jgi:CBS-domain-containing membrane protein
MHPQKELEGVRMRRRVRTAVPRTAGKADQIRDLMTTSVRTLHPDDSLAAPTTSADPPRRHVPVVDAEEIVAS